MKENSPYVAGDFLLFVPISLLNERPKELNLSFSENLFTERVPENLLHWFHERAEVYPAKKSNNAIIVEKRPIHEPCRLICIDFPGHPQTMMFQLAEGKTEIEDNKYEFSILNTHPDNPPTIEQFKLWVTQSINQTAGAIVSQLTTDAIVANQTGSMLFTDSPFISDILSLAEGYNDTIDSEMANLSLKLEIPYLDNISSHDLMYLRNNDGDAFENFRISLQRCVRSLRHEKNKQKLAKQLEDIQHELVDVQVREIELKIKKLKKQSFIDIAIGIASLATVIPTSGASVVPFAISGSNLYKKHLAYSSQINSNPAYFLYRIKQEAK
jgi:hypothetical protein